ncbi:ODF3A-like protein [Mya arenaria]|uniref:ODF3A-like protein n=1 Tax=Mya arenaria TaxID=6604 RepID=A0ABY7DSW5_MYAAR|nr:ODF3A-like protein [Mya arenaria]WAQ99798.1 ODF3A-like protein [Mya arenaria]
MGFKQHDVTKKKEPAYSFGRRIMLKSTVDSPGPAYAVNPCYTRERVAPKYSLGFRTRFPKCDQNPAPSNYILPPVLGPSQAYKTSTASYSMTGRSRVGCYLEDLSNAPGPGHTKNIHPDVYMNKAPHYSLRSRNYMPVDNVQKPGPGAHCPETVKINRSLAPKYSLGVRHSEFVCPFIADIAE